MSQENAHLQTSSPTLHLSILFSLAVFIATLVMAFIFKIEVVARGQGRVIPTSRVQVIQPEFPSKIKSIFVQNGSMVEKGEPLVEFDAIDSNAELAKITAERERLNIETSRINTMITALLGDHKNKNFLERTKVNFKSQSSLNIRPFFTEQMALLESEIMDLLAELQQIEARHDASIRSEAVTQANISKVSAALDIQAERLSTSKKLLDKGNSSRSAFLDVQQSFTDLTHQRDVLQRELEQKISERFGLNADRRRAITDRSQRLLSRKTEIESRLALLAEEANSAKRRLDSAILRAPMSGTVDQLKVFTLGGVAESGAELMRIVPADLEIEIEATFSNQDIGFVAVGQATNIRMDAFPSERFGLVKGEVKDLSADSVQSPAGEWGYAVRIRPATNFLKAGNEQFSLRPGMTATIDVTTDERRLISYFFAPILRTIEDSLGER